jgi:raffinose/stachyose/melibiose transport system permease protein
MNSRATVRDLLPYLAIGFFFVVQLFPLMWVISASLQTPETLAQGPSNKLWPSSFYLGNYIRRAR